MRPPQDVMSRGLGSLSLGFHQVQGRSTGLGTSTNLPRVSAKDFLRHHHRRQPMGSIRKVSLKSLNRRRPQMRTLAATLILI